MTHVMSPSKSVAALSLFTGCLLYVLQCTSANSGPVFVNPANVQAHAQVPQATQAVNLVTQTVYGFLDFTTTIGNTVMVFSPQSVAQVEPKNSAPSNNAVIDTKPSSSQPQQQQQQTTVIKPSKTVQKPPEHKQSPSEPAAKKISSVVQVQPAAAPAIVSTRIETEPKTKIVERISSVVHVAKPVPVSSKVEVAAPKIITKVDVIAAAPSVHPHYKGEIPQILSSKVEVFEGLPATPAPTPQAFVVSSVVAVKSDDEPALIGNNIGEAEYDFLSRQPSEVVEETYKVINLKPSAKFHLKPRPPLPGHTKVPHHGHGHGSGAQSSPQKRADAHPTGLVTKLGGTVVKDGATTVHETSVIGTYISGKYAQVLQSTSHIINHGKPKINPSQSLRILKTAAPVLGGKAHKHHHLEPTPAGSLHEETVLPVEGLFNPPGSPNNLIKPTRRPPTGPGIVRSNDFKPRFRNRKQEPHEVEEEVEVEQEIVQSAHGNFKKSARPRPSQTLRPFKHNKFGRTSAELATVSVFSEQTTASAAAPGRRYQSSRRHKSRPAAATATASTQATPATESGSYTRRGYKPRVQSSAAEPAASASSSSLYKFKLNRAPGRWQYKTTPKPRVTIRRQGDDDDDSNTLTASGSTTPISLQDVSPYLNDVVTPQSRSDDLDLNPLGSETSNANINDESATDNNKLEQAFPLETIKVEISTPADFRNVYYELATIKSPYTFQVGSVKNTRYITVTSTYERTLDPTDTGNIAATSVEPLSENILATSQHYDKDNNLDSGIATLPALYLAGDMATPPLETLTETFSTTQDMLKTHILPVVRGGNETTSYTLVQTYHVTRLVTATKTLPPMEAYHFVPSKTLKDFNSHLDEAGSELHLELEFGDDNDENEGHLRKSFPADLNLANIGSEFDLSDVDKSRLPEAHLRLKKAHAPAAKVNMYQEQPATPALSPELQQQLALLRLLNPAASQPQIITTSRPVVKLETVYESHIIPLVNGASTSFSTISRPVATLTRTDYEFGTSTLSPLAGLPNGLPPGLPQGLPPVNPFAPQQQQQQYSVTSTPVVTQTVVTQTDSKILKLTFGAKTAYTTIISTRVIPTVLTTFVTQSVPVQPSAFQGYFPAPYAPFPYVG